MKLFLVVISFFLLMELCTTLGTKTAKSCKDISWCKAK